MVVLGFETGGQLESTAVESSSSDDATDESCASCKVGIGEKGPGQPDKKEYA